MIVKFIKNHTPYMAGETAGFSDDRAKALIASGVALAADGTAPAPVAAVITPSGIVTKPVPASAPAPVGFDPLTADIAAVRAFLAEHNARYHHKTGDAKLREMALEIVTK